MAAAYLTSKVFPFFFPFSFFEANDEGDGSGLSEAQGFFCISFFLFFWEANDKSDRGLSDAQGFFWCFFLFLFFWGANDELEDTGLSE